MRFFGSAASLSARAKMDAHTWPGSDGTALLSYDLGLLGLTRTFGVAGIVAGAMQRAFRKIPEIDSESTVSLGRF